MAKIALNLSNLTDTGRIDKGRTALTAAGTPEGISVLGTPAPAEVAALLAATDGLDTARSSKLTATNALSTAVINETAALTTFNDAYSAFGRIGQTKTGGDPGKISAIGMDVAVGHSPLIGALTAPQNLSATMSEVPGQVNLTCDHVTGAKLYIWHACPDPAVDANWRQVGTDSKCKFSVGSLTSGTKHWFRVAALGTGTGNQSPWSDPALKMAP